MKKLFYIKNKKSDPDYHEYAIVAAETKEEALALADIFDRMIKGTVTEDELEQLDEAASLQDVSHMPARVKCAMLGWRTMKEMLGIK